MKYLVTGGSGYLGIHVRRFFEADDFSRRSYLDILNEYDVSRVGDYDVVIHLAAHLDKRPEEAESCFRVNAGGTASVARHMRAGAVLIYASTKDVYGSFADSYTEVPESCSTEYSDQSALEWSKLLGERYIEYYAHQRDFRFCIFRLSTVYARPSEDNQPGFVTHYVESVKRGWPIRLPLDGTPVRDILHVDDFSRACRAFAESALPRGLYNLGGGKTCAVTLREIIDTVGRMIEREPVIDETARLPAPTPVNYVSDLSRIRTELGWMPETGVEEAQESVVRARNLRAEEIERIIVRGVSWVGDAVMTIPALKRLRLLFPHAHITLATRAWARGVFDETDFLDDKIVEENSAKGLRALVRQIREWRENRFTLSILFQNSFQSALVAAASGIPYRIGYATEGRGLLLTHQVAPPVWQRDRHEVFYYLNLIDELSKFTDGLPQLNESFIDDRIYISPERRARARELLSARGIRLDRPLVVFCPGSTNSRAKRWPGDRYALLADRLIEETASNVILTGSSRELDVTREVAAQMRNRPFILTGETDLSETAAILSVCNLLITNDTGPAHLAGALNRPALVIFGPTNPVTTRPFSASARILHRPPECAPCMLRDCPIDHRCMKAITVADVYDEAVQLIGQGREAEVLR